MPLNFKYDEYFSTKFNNSIFMHASGQPKKNKNYYKIGLMLTRYYTLKKCMNVRMKPLISETQGIETMIKTFLSI